MRRVHPTIGVREDDVIKVDEHFGFQKSMVGMHRLWEEGNCAVIHGAGYEQPSFSHFASSSFWHTGAPNSGEAYGWYGRTADALDPSGTPNFLVNISSAQSLAVQAHEHVPVVFQDAGAFRRDFFHPQNPYIDNSRRWGCSRKGVPCLAGARFSPAVFGCCAARRYPLGPVVCPRAVSWR